MKTLILILVLGGLLAAAALGATAAWTAVGEAPLSGHGVAALVLGVLASLGLGAWLMFLVFYSSRRGHDEDAAAWAADPERVRPKERAGCEHPGPF